MRIEHDKCPKCGNGKFSGHQQVFMDVFVDSKGDWISDASKKPYDSNEPYGPFTCTKCGAEYETLPLFAEKTAQDLAKEFKGLNPDDLQAYLDEMVDEKVSGMASSINNEGIKGQLEFLLKDLNDREKGEFLSKIRDEVQTADLPIEKR